MEEIDHEYTREVVCPYCGYKYSESYEFTEDCSDVKCDECEKSFSYERVIDVTYSTHKLCAENGEQHQFGEPKKPHIYNDKYISGKFCKVCGKCELVAVNPETGEFIKPPASE